MESTASQGEPAGSRGCAKNIYRRHMIKIELSSMCHAQIPAEV